MIKRRTFLSGVSFLTLWQLSGCSTLAFLPNQKFSARGRFTLIATSPEGKVENLSGKYSFTRTDSLIRLDLLTPLNGVLARIEMRDGIASFSRGINEAPITAPNVETLMNQNLGFSVPIEALEEWATTTGAPQGYGWNIRVLKRENQRPKTIRAHQQFPHVDVKVTIIFDEVFP